MSCSGLPTPDVLQLKADQGIRNLWVIGTNLPQYHTSTVVGVVSRNFCNKQVLYNVYLPQIVDFCHNSRYYIFGFKLTVLNSQFIIIIHYTYIFVANVLRRDLAQYLIRWVHKINLYSTAIFGSSALKKYQVRRSSKEVAAPLLSSDPTEFALGSCHACK